MNILITITSLLLLMPSFSSAEVTEVTPIDNESVTTTACGRIKITSRRGGNTRKGAGLIFNKCGYGAASRTSHNAFGIRGNWIEIPACGGRAFIHKANISPNNWSRIRNQCGNSNLAQVASDVTNRLAPGQTPPQPMTTSSGALSYASAFTSCAAYGRRSAARYARSRGKRSGCGYCANGTRHAMMCMFKKIGQTKRTVHCGGAAYDYTPSCMARYGFVKDMSACNKPGVIRVYRGGRHKQSGARGGDRYGHIEFKGTDGRWHAGCSSPQPINERLGNARRILRGCYVLK